MEKNDIVNRYTTLIHDASPFMLKQLIRKLIKEIEKPKVNEAFIWKMVDDSVFILHQERAEFYKKKFKEAGFEVE